MLWHSPSEPNYKLRKFHKTQLHNKQQGHSIQIFQSDDELPRVRPRPSFHSQAIRATAAEVAIGALADPSAGVEVELEAAVEAAAARVPETSVVVVALVIMVMLIMVVRARVHGLRRRLR